MHRSRTITRLSTAVVLTLASFLAIGAVGASAQSDVPAEAEATQLTVGLGYIPSVQFSQFYLADEAGYYEEAGLDVTFQNKIDPELVTLLAQGSVDIGMSDGTSLIPAVSQGIPVVYGATIYARDPNVVFSLAETGIESVADLAGRSIGIPGRYGSSWVALQALLESAGLTPEDVEIVTYPDFGQSVAVAQGQVDAATGFVTNEPVQLRLQGLDVNVLHVYDVARLPGPGLVTGRDTLEAKGDALQAFTAATVRAMEDIVADPLVGLDATFTHVPELAGTPETQLAILEATIGAWSSDYTVEYGLGTVDREAWQSGIDIMTSLPDSVVASPVTVDELVTDALLP
ncbi:MAG: ABC transporter substrate-binding protein [Chloroflexota bacterium]|nr:ABC transporter substrate-binding protein [Chloroflexota bacterium]